ncbi:nitroreductase family protein [Christensenella hongkongensis]|uniref:nitroreductase family protein n=1 Tax=Christensenella hongkongensis TaxID=270498 RepID=UPI002673F86C|nr:nitroreductase family protein [Christensenella hongkongensis]
MDYEALYEAIFHRRSVRKYDSAPLPDETIAELAEVIEKLIPLRPEIQTDIRILGPGDIRTNAPHCICVYSEKKEGYRMNAGFLAEQIDLYLSSKNIGACWLGTTKPDKNKVAAPAGMEWVISLCFGTPAQPMHREGAEQFNRKSLNEISSITDLFHVLEAVRLAPSAMNKQPWYFSGTAEDVVVSRKKSLLLGNLNQVDVGIALCCFFLAVKHQGKNAEFSFEPQTVPDKHIFMARAKVV